MSASRVRPADFPSHPVEPATLLTFCSVDEHATHDERSATRRDAAVAPNEPGHAPARAADRGWPSMPRATNTPTLLPLLPWLVLNGPEPLRVPELAAVR